MTAAAARTRPAPRLFAILARDACVGIVFRRGPANQVLLIAWDTAKDVFEPGQWFKGRIYERRCDLSPSGRKLIYFAGNQKPPYRTWTAVSTPPYLTALALWPLGHTWGGGGSFETERRLYLHHGCQADLADGFRLPKDIEIVAKTARSNDPYARDGWSQTSLDTKRRLYYAEHTKRQTVMGDRVLELRMYEEVFFEKGSEQLREYRLTDLARQKAESLGFLDWADWDRNGDLLFANDGKLFRAKPRATGESAYDMARAKELADFGGLTFRNVAAPAEAMRW